MFEKSSSRVRALLRLLILVIVACSPAASLAEYYSVLIPDVAATAAESSNCKSLCVSSNEEYKSTAQSFFSFDISALPTTANILSVELRLSESGESMSGQAAQAFQVNHFTSPVRWDDKPVISGPALAGSVEPGVFYAAYPGADAGLAGALNAALKTGDRLYLGVKATGYETNLDFEPSDASSPSDRPRLVVNYELANPATMNWPQPQYDAQQTGRSNWQANVFPQGVNDPQAIYTAKTASSLHMAPIFYAGNVYTVEQSTDGYFVVGVSPENGTFAQSSNLKSQPIFQPVVDPNGILYYPTADGIQLIQLGADLTILPSNPVGSLVLKRPPLVARDGSVYLTDDSVIAAYTAYPQLEKFWSYQLSGTPAAVGISADRSVAYISELMSKDGKHLIKLTALDNRTKRQLGQWTSDPGQWSEAPIPVSGADGVYLALDSGIFDVSQVFGFSVLPDSSNWSEKWSVKCDSSKKYATLVIGSNGDVIAVCGETIARYDGGTGSPVAQFKLTQDWMSNLVMDGGDNLILFEGHSLTAFDSTLERLYTADMSHYGDINENLILAPDGTLYVHDNAHVYSIGMDLKQDNVPAKVSVPLVPGKDIYRAQDTVTVESKVTVTNTDTLILQSGGSISISPNFSVEKGAWLILETGM
ncbi:MAG: hypothetical protein JJ956_10670 [Pseudomonadales bacterium]|nr:hypothetical protein [Pseudomonadales bacterium]